MFIKHLKIMVNHQNLMISVSILAITMVLDYILIDQHPDLLNNEDVEDFIASHVSEDIVTDKDIEAILEDIDLDDVQSNLDDDDRQEYPGPRTKAFYQLPTDYKTPSYDLDEDCYRRGDGRGNNRKVQRYYTKDVL